MENMDQLKDLLKHELKDLYSAEEQIIDALPKMIEKANNKSLKQALEEHLTVTHMQKERLDEAIELLEGEEDNKSFLSGLFKDSKADEKCKAMEGLITEGEKLLKEDMSPEVTDAAIIAAAQKIEHYEISSYGTVRAYAQELKLDEVEALLKETLDEEYEADDRLTQLAESRINIQATGPASAARSSERKRPQTASNGRSRSTATATASNSRSGSPKRGKSSSNGRSAKTSGSRSNSGSSRGKKNSRGRSSGR